jgi:hypothetical protein
MTKPKPMPASVPVSPDKLPPIFFGQNTSLRHGDLVIARLHNGRMRLDSREVLAPGETYCRMHTTIGSSAIVNVGGGYLRVASDLVRLPPKVST